MMIYDELYDELWHATADSSLVNSVVKNIIVPMMAMLWVCSSDLTGFT